VVLLLLLLLLVLLLQGWLPLVCTVTGCPGVDALIQHAAGCLTKTRQS
jgi:hypothetical protein